MHASGSAGRVVVTLRSCLTQTIMLRNQNVHIHLSIPCALDCVCLIGDVLPLSCYLTVSMGRAGSGRCHLKYGTCQNHSSDSHM